MKSDKPLFTVILKILCSLLLIGLVACQSEVTDNKTNSVGESVLKVDTVEQKKAIEYIIERDIPIRDYFNFMDTLVAYWDTILPYSVSEHLIVLNNSWLIDTLENTDYYRLKEKGVFSEDPQSLLALRKGEKLIIPDSLQVDALNGKLAATVIDVNIPEFKLRILEDGKTMYSFPVRVGKVEKKYLAMAGREVDLRTKTGEGKIIRINRKPKFVNPTNNKRYYVTKRDDGKITKLPLVPWIEPEIDGHRFGQLIHPTTNPRTLGKASSNGCIGMKEADMWRLYYHAPLGTKVVIRYDLEVINETDDTTILKNIYPGFERKQKRKEILAATLLDFRDTPQVPEICDCTAIGK